MATATANAYRYYGQFDPPVDRFLHERYFSTDPYNRLLIECGAFDGITENCGRFFEETLHWRCINIEPSPRIFEKLSVNRPDSVNLNVALSDEIGFREFQDVNYPSFDLCTNGSLDHTDTHYQHLVDNGCTFDTSKVATTTFADLIRNYQIQDIELMVLDVEGHEIQALQGFRDAATLPRILCVEHGHLGIDHLKPHVEALGYRFDTSSFVNSFYILDR